MLAELLQTIANLGFDVSVINRAFNEIFHAVNSGQTEVISSLRSVFNGVLPALSNTSDAWHTIAAALMNSVLDLLAHAGSSSVLHMITGA